MTRAEARRRKRKKKMQQIGAWTVLILFELIVSAAPAALVAAIALPFAYAERGYMGIGGEWLIITAVFCFAYNAIHERICDRIFGEEE